MNQTPPFAVQIELVEGCTLDCSFCGIHGIRANKGQFKFMSSNTARRIASAIADAGWNPRIEFAMHGEPSVHPEAPSIVGIFRTLLPNASIMMTSNGSGFLGSRFERINHMFQLGLNVLALDWYDHASFVPDLRKILDEKALLYSLYPDDPDANPHKRRNPKIDKDIVIIRDISSAETGTHSVLNNHCGTAFPVNDKQRGKRCAKPFRELSFRWDGNVALCCNDWRGVYKIGNLKHFATIEDLWNSDAFASARKFLYHGMRTFAPCEGCDAVSYRVGLLPDKKGKESLPVPEGDDWKVVLDAAKDDPYTIPVLREWEQ